MDFNGYIEEPVYNTDGSIAYTQYVMNWRTDNE